MGKETRKCTVANSATSPDKISHAKKVAEALELRLQDLTFEQIGERMGISRSYVYKLVNEGLDADRAPSGCSI